MSVEKILSPSSLDYGKKKHGTLIATFNIVGTQIDASRIFAMVTFPFICENANYSITVTSCTLLGVSSITPSTISIDNKTSTGARIEIPYSGTVGRAYAVVMVLNITF